MKCNNCNAELTIRAEFCPKCGQKINFSFDKLAQTMNEDADLARGQRLTATLGWVLMMLIIAATTLYSLNTLLDKPLLYTGAALPALPGDPLAPADSTPASLVQEPRPAPPLPQPLVTAFGYRRAPMRTELRQANNGAVHEGKSIETAVRDGLKFLAHAQQADGSWLVKGPPGWPGDETPQYDWGRVGVTGLALLAFFGDGETWLPDGEGHPAEFGDVLRKGVRFLLDQQDPATGRFGPGVGEAVHHMYNHAFATEALVEAAGLTGDPNLKDAAQKGLDLIVKTQAVKGGWNYWGRQAGDSDTFVTAWQVQALLTGREAGFKVPDETLAKAAEMYKNVTHGDGYVNYSLEEKTPDKDARRSRCAVAFAMRQMLGEEAASFRFLQQTLLTVKPQTRKEWANWTPQGSPDDFERGRYDPHILYYATYGFFLAGGKDWETWNDAIKAAVPQMQDSDGAWRANDPYSKQGGVIYSTALSILTLQVYYRAQ